MYQAQVNEYKFEIDRVTRDMQDLKKKYFEQKKKEQISLRNELDLKPNISPEAPKFVGAGFNMNPNIAQESN
jgi:hypothetical protein